MLRGCCGYPVYFPYTQIHISHPRSVVKFRYLEHISRRSQMTVEELKPQLSGGKGSMDMLGGLPEMMECK